MAEKLKQEGKQEILQNEVMEELEDDEGNVYNRKVRFCGSIADAKHVCDVPSLTAVHSCLTDLRGPQATRFALRQRVFSCDAIEKSLFRLDH